MAGFRFGGAGPAATGGGLPRARRRCPRWTGKARFDGAGGDHAGPIRRSGLWRLVPAGPGRGTPRRRWDGGPADRPGRADREAVGRNLAGPNGMACLAASGDEARGPVGTVRKTGTEARRRV
ncbi:hypothetical protein GCM10010215_27840 [Streptomyces virginiae]|uniref:Uncharacterized protein n=1 Tax=Streptomyces virginiae TaxID=1961 RepID=A0ABQ3NY15_STRVG|nr:hypothetical protein GCM10010215_27840 [Streptomyces virginiae]GHI17668.1 hypothetical protein Scinn_71310 [Streptomyces virginiae]GLV91339.1 hypothetical protein Slala04_27930 [Streptomyces lavendulae subsp. lavendulae]